MRCLRTIGTITLPTHTYFGVKEVVTYFPFVGLGHDLYIRIFTAVIKMNGNMVI